MSLDITFLETKEVEVYDANITHNLMEMAEEAGVYSLLWLAPGTTVFYAHQITDPLLKAITDMKANPSRYKKFNPENGWGSYEDFLSWLEKLYIACTDHPDARIEISK